jgi:hypothetical protein
VVLADPVRVRVLEVLNEREMSPAEFCREGFAPEDMEVSRVADHFRDLAEYGCLEVVEEGGAGGPVYRGLARGFYSDPTWSGLDRDQKHRISRNVFQGLLARAEGALLADTFDSRDDRHLSWIAMRLDEQGWREMVTALAAAFGEVEQIRGDAEERLARSGRSGTFATCAILGFESPPSPSAPRSSSG